MNLSWAQSYKDDFEEKRKRKRERNPMRPGFVSEMTVTLKPVIGGGRHSSADPTELHSCGPSSNSKYNIYAFLNLYSNCDPNRTKINKKRHF